MIPSKHAEKRIKQVSEICLRIIREHEEEAEEEYQEAIKAGFDVEKKSVGINLQGNSLYRDWQEKIIFYAQYL